MAFLFRFKKFFILNMQRPPKVIDANRKHIAYPTIIKLSSQFVIIVHIEATKINVESTLNITFNMHSEKY